MKNRISSVFILFLLLFTNSCMDLDKEPLDMISSDAVFKDEALSEAYLYKIYGYMPCGYGLFVEAGANVLSGMGCHLLAAAACLKQCLSNRRVTAAAIKRLLNCDNIRIQRGLL